VDGWPRSTPGVASCNSSPSRRHSAIVTDDSMPGDAQVLVHANLGEDRPKGVRRVVAGLRRPLTDRRQPLQPARHQQIDPKLGRFLSKNLAGYLIPVQADVPDLDASFIEDEVDVHANLLGAKGIGELTAVGVGAAIANAVFHATGTRVRELPITPEALLPPP
jgi:hypothetical protein